MRKGRREMIEKGSREGIEKETKRQGLRDPALLEFLDPTLQCSHCFSKSSGYDKLELKHQNWFLQAYRMHYSNKTLGTAQDPRANGAWLSKLTE